MIDFPQRRGRSTVLEGLCTVWLAGKKVVLEKLLTRLWVRKEIKKIMNPRKPASSGPAHLLTSEYNGSLRPKPI